MGYGFVILFFLVVIFVVSAVVAIIAVIITAIASKQKRKRKVFAALISPFLFFFGSFFIAFFGATAVSEWKGVDIGIGDSWYVKIDGDYSLSMIDGIESGYIDFKDKQLESGVVSLQHSGDRIFGLTEAGHYFKVDMTSGNIKEYSRETDFFNAENLTNQTLNLEPVGDYYHRQSAELAGYWMHAAGIIALFISAGLVFLFCRFVVFGRTLGLAR